MGTEELHAHAPVERHVPAIAYRAPHIRVPLRVHSMCPKKRRAYAPVERHGAETAHRAPTDREQYIMLTVHFALLLQLQHSTAMAINFNIFHT